MSTGGGGGFEPNGTNAWLMRFMWREEAKAEVYSLLPPSKFNNFKTSFDVQFDFQFSTGKWYCIEQYAKLNSVGRDDGQLKVWIDGVKLLDRSDVLYRTVDNQNVKIGGFYFSTFHGGDTPAWAPRVDSYARFDAIVLSEAPVGMVASTPVSTSALTTATPVAAASQAPEQPRMALGHPRTIWDQQDVARYKELLKTSPELKSAFDQLQAWAEQRIREPLNVPAHTLEADGTWNFPSFPRGIQDAQGKWIWKWDFNTALQNRSADVSKLGVLYALTGNQEYADYARKLLLAMADAYGYGQGSTAPDPHGFDHFEAYGFDGGDAGMVLTKACSGYDLIYNATAVTAEDRTHIEKDLVRPLAEHLKKAKYMYTGHGRWGMVCLYGIVISGVTLGDQDMVTGTLYGLGGTTEKPTGGFMDCFRPAYIREDRLWGADEKPEDQIASLAIMTSVAEVMWRRGVDLYSHQDMALKKPFDAGLPLILPTSSTAPANDSEYGKLLGMPGINAYEYAFRRFHDARYLPLIEKLRPTLVLSVGELPSLFDARALPK
jgi:hypothetical protein